MSLAGSPFTPARNSIRRAIAPALLAVLAFAAPQRAAAQTAVQFDGTNDYVTFGQATSTLGAKAFTLECWFRRTGAGVSTTTGTGGVTNAIPLLTKGRGEAEGSTVDCNWFLGIRASDSVLVADYEEGTGQTSPGLNHPVTGVTPLARNVWYHAAATFDGTTWRLYLNGNLESTVVVGAARLPQWASIQHAGLGSAMTSTGAAAGFFAGAIDEARVWDHARPQAGIRDSAVLEITGAPGLLGRWGLNEATGTTAANSVAGGPAGTLTNGPAWVGGAPFSFDHALQFHGTNSYVSFGDAPALRLPQWTVECWFRRDGAGQGTQTGAGGSDSAIPLIAKGRGELDSSTVNVNYFLGIDAATAVMVADFEEADTGADPFQNHPVFGATPVTTGVWHHAAATYDGVTLVLYLDGYPEGSVTVGQPCGFDGTHPVSIGSALYRAGAAGGFLDGVVDEARIWSYARTPGEITGAINSRIAGTQSGLVARWGLDEGVGATVASSAGTALPGAILGTAGSGWEWSAGAPFDFAPPTPPAAPGGLLASALSNSVIRLTWTDNASNEARFVIERSTTGAGGAYTPRDTVGANVTSWDDAGLTALTEYCYRVRAENGAGVSADAGPACATTPAVPRTALDLTASTYVSFGDPAALDLAQFTIECWFRRDGAGAGTSTGTGGVADGIPLVAKGRAEAEVSNVDLNWFFGISDASDVLCADFEEGAAGASPSLNHPVYGVTPITTGVWHHGAVTYDGATWSLYLDGNLETTLAVNQPCASASTQPAALGSALTSAGAAAGFFDGALDEVRVWNVARTQSQIFADANSEIGTPTANLVARWALDEASGTAVTGSAGTTVNGAITGAGYAWVAPAPFDLTPPAPPDAPTGLTATAAGSASIHLTWVDQSSNETRFEIERSTSGSGGPFTPLANVGAGVTSYDDNGLTASTPYCYQVRAANGGGNSSYAGPACATTTATPHTALDLAGSTYVGFGDPAALDLAQFTIECWFRRDAAGTTASTGSGGVTDAIPLVTKGRGESEAANVDLNWFLGISDAADVLCADFEEGAGGASPSLNHPVFGVTPIALGVWHHAAVTYDGATWNLYLDGNLETTLAINQPCASASTQQAALGSALTSTGVAAGYFNGALDEVRVWNVARTLAQIRGTVNAEITTATPNLVARWGLDEAAGTAVGGSAGTAVNGSITGSAYAWVTPAPFDLGFNDPPAYPALVAPANGATGVARPASLQVQVEDADGDSVTVTWYGRTAAIGPGPDFTLIPIPDTQYYTAQINGGSNAILKSQMDWIVANRQALNIRYVGGLGDCTDGNTEPEWMRADTSMSKLEDPATTLLAEGIPYGVSVGNHDQTPNGSPDGASTTFFNQYFGEARFAGRSYYGGHFGANNDNWYQFFSASGMDFIVISFEYDTTPDADVLQWGDDLLTSHPNHKGIVLTHNAINTGNPGSWNTQGQAIYNQLRDNPNFTLFLAGHVPGEGRRSDTFDGRTVYTLLSDYQSRTNGGNGWLRIMTFSPANNVARVRTYSPWLNQYEADADSSSQFTIPYDMGGAGASYVALGTKKVAAGETAAFDWTGLDPTTAYEWYAVVSDGQASRTGPAWTFTTGVANQAPVALVIAPNGGGTLNVGSNVNLQWTATDDVGVARVALLLSRNGAGGTFDTLVTNVPNTGTHPWLVTGPATADAYLKVVAWDAADLAGEDLSDAAFTISSGPTGIDDATVVEFALAPVTPNPAAGRAAVGFAVPHAAPVRITVHDVQGREIARLADRTFEPGRHQVTWEAGRGRAPAGLYFIRMQAADRTFTRRIVLTH